jgi:hypothetical protein
MPLEEAEVRFEAREGLIVTAVTLLANRATRCVIIWHTPANIPHQYNIA